MRSTELTPPAALASHAPSTGADSQRMSVQPAESAGQREQNRPLRVVYVISAIHTEQAGTEGHLLRLIRRLDRRRVEPRLVVLQPTPWSDRFHEDDVPLTVLGFRSWRRPGDWSAIRRLRDLLANPPADVVELHSTDAHVVGSLAARWAGVPVILSCRRDLGHQLTTKDRLLHRLGNRLVHHFLANSNEVARHFARHERIQDHAMSVIHNGLDLDDFDRHSEQDSLPQSVVASLGDGPVVVMTANLRPIKDHATLIHAAQIVAQRYPNTRWLLLGTGPERANIEQLAMRLGIADSIVWGGAVEHVAAWLKRATIGCLSSRSEGFSNALIEYMAAGLPVVATRTGGASEAVEDGRSGLLVEPGDPRQLADSLLQLIADPERARTMGCEGRRRVERQFTMAAQLDNYYQLYDELHRRHCSTA